MPDLQEPGVAPETSNRPVPPVRTRWIESHPAVAAGAILPPAQSAPGRAPARRVAGKAPAAPADAIAGGAAPDASGDAPSGVAASDVSPVTGAASLDVTLDLEPMASGPELRPWDDPAFASLELTQEFTVELETEAEFADEALLELDEIVPETKSLEPLPEGLVPVHAPLSAWDIVESPAQSEAGLASQAARAREEWEALGQALAASIGGEDASVFESAIHALAEGIAAGQSTGVTPEILDIADRIAWFASQLRRDGYRTITNAQARGDRLDIALAGLAAGFLAGRTE
ncbi:MAG: hypothetical protein ACREL7_00085 [Longimicrobiales bacterium]